MTHYKTKLEAYRAGYEDGYFRGTQEGKAMEKARAKKKLDPHYNRPLSLKERVDREAEAERFVGMTESEIMGDEFYLQAWQGLGKTKQPSLWSRFVKFINIKQYLM
jgi:hypothetical protein